MQLKQLRFIKVVVIFKNNHLILNELCSFYHLRKQTIVKCKLSNDEHIFINVLFKLYSYFISTKYRKSEEKNLLFSKRIGIMHY